MKPGTGEILAMLGSVDYYNETIDGHVNVALSGQQPGSSVKPLTYAAALSPGADGSAPTWTAADLLWDVPVDYPQFDGATYTPLNYDRTYHGPVRLREALANIQDGSYAKKFLEEGASGYPIMTAARAANAAHGIELVGEKLRGMMPWIAANKIVDKAKN